MPVEPAPSPIPLQLRVSQLAPDAGTLKTESRLRPGEPPVSLVEFNSDLAQKLDVARGSPAASARLFTELEECIHSPRLRETDPTRAICLSNARALAAHSAELRPRFELLSREVGPFLRKLTVQQ